MAGVARGVADLAHQITQRGDGRLNVFFTDDDDLLHRGLLSERRRKAGGPIARGGTLPIRLLRGSSRRSDDGAARRRDRRPPARLEALVRRDRRAHRPRRPSTQAQAQDQEKSASHPRQPLTTEHVSRWRGRTKAGL